MECLQSICRFAGHIPFLLLEIPARMLPLDKLVETPGSMLGNTPGDINIDPQGITNTSVLNMTS